MFVCLKYIHGVSLNKVTQYTQISADVQKLLIVLLYTFNLLFLLCEDQT